MKKLVVLGILIPWILLSGSIASAFDLSQVHNLVVFGDSLSDNGNSFAAVGLPQPPYYNGRWTNGPDWVDYFTKQTGLPPATAYLKNGGTNFAVGGSISPLLSAQILVFLATVGGNADSANLYVIWIGSNDFSSGISPSATVDSITAEIAVLRAAGAEQFLLMNVPDISLTPQIIASGGAQVQAAKQFVTSVNTSLQTRIPLLALLLGAQIDLIDVNPLLTELVDNPTAFGFKNSTGEAYNKSTGVVAEHPNTYVFWDGFHPTTHVHRIAAKTFEQDATAANVLIGLR